MPQVASDDVSAAGTGHTSSGPEAAVWRDGVRRALWAGPAGARRQPSCAGQATVAVGARLPPATTPSRPRRLTAKSPRSPIASRLSRSVASSGYVATPKLAVTRTGRPVDARYAVSR